jgi:hypothetical protein
MRRSLLILVILVACGGRDDAAFRDGVRHAQLLLEVLQEQRAAGNLSDWKTWNPPVKRECVSLGETPAPGCDALPDSVFHAILLPDVDRPATYYSYYILWIDLSKDGALKKPGTTYVDVNLVPIGGYEILRINAAPDVELIGATSNGTADERDGAYHVIIHSGGTLRFGCASKSAAHPFSCEIDARDELGDVGIVYRAADRSWHVVGPARAGS